MLLPCQDNHCQNDGSCFLVGEDDEPTCFFLLNSGPECETEVHLCDMMPCVNNGTCIPTGPNRSLAFVFLDTLEQIVRLWKILVMPPLAVTMLPVYLTLQDFSPVLVQQTSLAFFVMSNLIHATYFNVLMVAPVSCRMAQLCVSAQQDLMVLCVTMTLMNAVASHVKITALALKVGHQHQEIQLCLLLLQGNFCAFVLLLLLVNSVKQKTFACLVHVTTMVLVHFRDRVTCAYVEVVILISTVALILMNAIQIHVLDKGCVSRALLILTILHHSSISQLFNLFLESTYACVLPVCKTVAFLTIVCLFHVPMMPTALVTAQVSLACVHQG